MFGRIWNCIKRHKKKFIFTGTLIGGSWLLIKYLQRKIKDIRDDDDKDYLATARRQHHFDSNQRTCNLTVLSMLPAIRESLERALNTESLTTLLKSNPSNKVQLWEELKVLSFARCVSSIYGCSIMALLLRVQLNLIGGYIYLDNASIESNSIEEEQKKMLAPRVLQERYLSLINYFIQRGVVDLSHYVQQAVFKEVNNLSLKESVSLENIQSIITNIRQRVECGSSDPKTNVATMPLCAYMLPGEQVPDIEMGSNEDDTFDRIIGETRDILESKDFHAVLHSCLERGFSRLLDCLAEHYKHFTNSVTQLHDVTVPLAKLIPAVSRLLEQLCSDAPNRLIQEFLVLDDVKTLSANIYEAFSQQHTASSSR